MKKEPSRRQRWLPYVRSIADAFGLKDWQVGVRDDAPPTDASASVAIPFCRRIAAIRLSDGFLGEDRAEQRYEIVHELVHAHIETYVEAVRVKTGDDPILTRLMELAVDGLASGVAPHLPLPPAKL